MRNAQEAYQAQLPLMTMILILILITAIISMMKFVMMTRILKIKISGWPTLTNAKSCDSMLTSDALHLHEPSGLQLCLWMVLWISLAGLLACNHHLHDHHHYHLKFFFFFYKTKLLNTNIIFFLLQDWTDLGEGWLYGEWETGEFLYFIHT